MFIGVGEGAELDGSLDGVVVGGAVEQNDLERRAADKTHLVLRTQILEIIQFFAEIYHFLEVHFKRYT